MDKIPTEYAGRWNSCAECRDFQKRIHAGGNRSELSKKYRTTNMIMIRPRIPKLLISDHPAFFGSASPLILHKDF